MELPIITDEIINNFLEGKDPQKNIVSIECGYQDNKVTVISKIKDQKVTQLFDFKPFIWATRFASNKLYGGDKDKIRQAMMEYHIGAKALGIWDKNGATNDRLENGYRVLFYAKQKMSYNYFLKFFKDGGIEDIYNDPDKGFLSLSPVELFMIESGKRQFKGVEDYDDLSRTVFDIETQGLDPEKHRITQIGIRTNRGFEHIIRVENNDQSEINSIIDFLQILKNLNFDVIAGHNSENFDWPFIMTRCEMIGINFKQLTEDIFGHSIYKKKRKTVLKLGGEIEYFNKTVFPFHIVLDSLHAVRRAQAIDSNMKSGSLKYVTKYAKLNKENRVYIKGDQIDIILNDSANDYAFNNDNGEWYKIDINNPLKEGYETCDSKYIVERYLKDDLYETDKVELTYNQQNFLLSKILPIPFEKVCTMGTASIWKSLMIAWSYENDLAIPAPGKAGRFTGGLSRLLKVGFVDNVVKLDFNSLYPSITLTWGIYPDSDISEVMLKFLENILTQREKYKALMKQAGKKCDNIKLQIEQLDREKEIDKYKILEDELKKWEIEEHANDKKQLPFKIFGNSFFGSFGAPNIFNWGDLKSAENITCVGRQSLRLMIKWFSDRGFNPIVGDTDGFNFQIPKNVENYSYISTGLNRNTEANKEYKGVEAYVAEFNDLFMKNKMGLGIDEFSEATINFSRKNYCDLLINKKTGEHEIKLVGNSIKSKKMPLYIENFMNEGISLLLHNNGYKFLNNYYEYIERIYNGNISLKEIASKGKIKKTIKEYKADCQTLNIAGNKKSHQAWYELCIQNNIEPDLGSTIYYINIGDGKGDGDVKREKIYKTDENGKFVKVDMIKDGMPVLTKTGKVKQEKVVIGEEVKLNCIMIPTELIENDSDLNEISSNEYNNIEYNTSKYIEQFNKKMKPLLVCFPNEIRDQILITNPKDAKYFTENEAKLISGDPYRIEDQDTYDQLMTMENKEIKFWVNNNKIPPFLEETGIDWEKNVNDYNDLLELQKNENIRLEIEKFNNIIDKLTEDDIDKIIETAILPSIITDFLKLDNSLNLISKENGIQIGTIYDIIDKNFTDNNIEDVINE